MVKNLPAIQQTQVRSLGWKIPHAMEQLSLRSATTGAGTPWSPYSARRGPTAVRSPRSLQREEACVQQ